jgi:hypothetical protein
MMAVPEVARSWLVVAGLVTGALAACAERKEPRVVVVTMPPPTSTASTGAPAPQPPAVAAVPQSAHTPQTCGEASLERAALVALGKGPNHPAVVQIDARLAECSNRSPSADDCRAVEAEHAELEARGYGPRHPDMVANDAKRVLCAP